LILIGDAGLYLEDDPTLAALGAWAQAAPSSSVVFLGDNIYDDGLREEDRVEAERILRQQLEATGARKVFIPGNHDWAMDPKEMNAQAIRNQQTYVDGWADGSAEFVPKDGCMGPSRRILSPREGTHPAVVLIALDPTPWIQPALRKACPAPESPQSHLDRLDALLAEHREDLVVAGSHYPMLTGGPHGGLSYGFIGDLIVGYYAWQFGGQLGDTYDPGYADWIEQTQAILRRNPPLVYAAGHDHSLQVLSADDVAGIYVVSGAGAPERVSRVTSLPESRFAHAAPGFVVIDTGTADGQAAAVLRVVENGVEAPVFELALR